MIQLDTITSLHELLTILLQSIENDLANSLFEVAGGFFALNHCRVLLAHKETRGVSLLSAAFFTCWGFWNLHYYTALSQPLSFYGAFFLASTNALYLGMMTYYRRASITQSWLSAEDEVYLAPESVGYHLEDKS